MGQITLKGRSGWFGITDVTEALHEWCYEHQYALFINEERGFWSKSFNVSILLPDSEVAWANAYLQLALEEA